MTVVSFATLFGPFDRSGDGVFNIQTVDGQHHLGLKGLASGAVGAAHPFLNRLLALTIDLQAVPFAAFEALPDQRIEGAIAAGVYDLGLETLRAESFQVTDARVIYTHPGSGAETQLLTIAEKRRNTPTSLADALDYVGVLALEFFVLEDGALLANEFAPRVHNSGHWTPEACATGQFEQHVRAVAGWPLGDVTRYHDVEMLNLLGEEALAPPADLLEGAVLTLYGKRDAKPGRKMGHLIRRLS